MEIWVVEEHIHYEGGGVLGVYSTRELGKKRAEAVFPKINGWTDNDNESRADPDVMSTVFVIRTHIDQDINGG